MNLEEIADNKIIVDGKEHVLDAILQLEDCYDYVLMNDHEDFAAMLKNYKGKFKLC